MTTEEEIQSLRQELSAGLEKITREYAHLAGVMFNCLLREGCSMVRCNDHLYIIEEDHIIDAHVEADAVKLLERHGFDCRAKDLTAALWDFTRLPFAFNAADLRDLLAEAGLEPVDNCPTFPDQEHEMGFVKALYDEFGPGFFSRRG